jgi:hypothetical protein
MPSHTRAGTSCHSVERGAPAHTCTAAMHSTKARLLLILMDDPWRHDAVRHAW